MLGMERQLNRSDPAGANFGFQHLSQRHTVDETTKRTLCGVEILHFHACGHGQKCRFPPRRRHDIGSNKQPRGRIHQKRRCTHGTRIGGGPRRRRCQDSIAHKLWKLHLSVDFHFKPRRLSGGSLHPGIVEGQMLHTLPVFEQHLHVEHRQMSYHHGFGGERTVKNLVCIVEEKPKMPRVEPKEGQTPPPVLLDRRQHGSIPANDQNAVGILGTMPGFKRFCPRHRPGISRIGKHKEFRVIQRPLCDHGGLTEAIQTISFDVSMHLLIQQVPRTLAVEDLCSDFRA